MELHLNLLATNFSIPLSTFCFLKAEVTVSHATGQSRAYRAGVRSTLSSGMYSFIGTVRYAYLTSSLVGSEARNLKDHLKSVRNANLPVEATRKNYKYTRKEVCTFGNHRTSLRSAYTYDVRVHLYQAQKITKLPDPNNKWDKFIANFSESAAIAHRSVAAASIFFARLFCVESESNRFNSTGTQ